MIPAMVVPTWTRHDLLTKMLATIDHPVRDLLVIANGGTRPEFDHPDAVQRVHVASVPSNLGVPASWNLGIKAFFPEDWVLVVGDDVEFPEGALTQFAEQARPDEIILSHTWPYWCAFAYGMDAVDHVGLFDERFYPAYYEDTEYEWRCRQFGFPVRISDIPVGHSNASTLNTPRRQFAQRKGVTDASNAALYHEKQQQPASRDAPFSLFRWRNQAW